MVAEHWKTVRRWANDGELVGVTYDLSDRTVSDFVRFYAEPVGLQDTVDSDASDEIAHAECRDPETSGAGSDEEDREQASSPSDDVSPGDDGSTLAEASARGDSAESDLDGSDVESCAADGDEEEIDRTRSDEDDDRAAPSCEANREDAAAEDVTDAEATDEAESGSDAEDVLSDAEDVLSDAEDSADLVGT